MSEAVEAENLEIKHSSEENVMKISEIQAKLSAEIENVDKNITEIRNLKDESIGKLERKKKDLRQLTNNVELCQEKAETEKELKQTAKEIEDRKASITLLDETIANFDKQISKIQAEHDKAKADLILKKKKLKEQLVYYNDLNKRLSALLGLLDSESNEHGKKICELLKKRSELLKRTDLSEEELKKLLEQLDGEINTLNAEHGIVVDAISAQLTGHVYKDPFFDDFETSELKEFERKLKRILRPKLSEAERLRLIRRGLIVTPSGRIITQRDRVLTLNEARLLGLLYNEEELEEEEMGMERVTEEIAAAVEKARKQYYLPSTPSSSEKSTSTISSLAGADVEYLKRVFGKSLTLALAEIVAVQPTDPIHYLAYWFVKYRFNQETDEIKRIELQALLIERERLEAERWRAELEEEARLAVLEALFRAENLIYEKEYASLAMLGMEDEFEGTAEFNPLEGLLP